jgi:hypothetical protein
MPRLDPKYASQRGQSLVSVLLLLFTLTSVSATVAIVGQATIRRVGIQMIADAGAWTGASVMATGMNQLSRLNAYMQYAWLLFTAPPLPVEGLTTGSPLYPAFKAQQLGTFLTAVPTVECNLADGWTLGYQAMRATIGAVYDINNFAFAVKARSEAVRVSMNNAADVFPGEELHFSEYPDGERLSETGGILPFLARNYGYLANTPGVPNGFTPKAGFLESLPNVIKRAYLVPATRSLRYGCVTIVPTKLPGSKRIVDLRLYQYRRASFLPPWRRKQPRAVPLLGQRSVDYFVWIVTAPAIRAPFFGRLLGDAVIPDMTAVAVARPVGGRIETGDARYVAKMVPVANVMATNHLASAVLPPWIGTRLLSHVGGIYDRSYNRHGHVRIVTH